MTRLFDGRYNCSNRCKSRCIRFHQTTLIWKIEIIFRSFLFLSSQILQEFCISSSLTYLSAIVGVWERNFVKIGWSMLNLVLKNLLRFLKVDQLHIWVGVVVDFVRIIAQFWRLPHESFHLMPGSVFFGSLSVQFKGQRPEMIIGRESLTQFGLFRIGGIRIDQQGPSPDVPIPADLRFQGRFFRNGFPF